MQHVGLYVGEGRFIHSARGGVQISELSAPDPVGKWWFEPVGGSEKGVVGAKTQRREDVSHHRLNQ